jgi:hypothetical protein
MKTYFVAVALAALNLAACDRSAQNADGATGKGEVGTAANTPTGQVVPTTGSNEEKLNAPEVTATPATPAEPANK